MLKQIMAHQPEELPGYFAAAATGDLGHGDLAVVVADPPGNASEESESPLVPFLERLRAFVRKYLAEDGVRIGQRHHEHRYLDLLATKPDLSFPKIDLGFARSMRERHKDLGLTLLPGPNGALNDRQTAVVLVLLAQPVENALGRVTLLLGRQSVLLEDLMNDS